MEEPHHLQGTCSGAEVMRWHLLSATPSSRCVPCPFADKLGGLLQLFLGFSDAQEVTLATILSAKPGVTTAQRRLRLRGGSNSPAFSGRKSRSQDSEQVCPALQHIPFHSATILPRSEHREECPI